MVALGRLSESAPQLGGDPRGRDDPGRVALPQAFDDFVADPEHDDLHPLRENGTRNYLWWLYDSLEDLRPLFAGR